MSADAVDSLLAVLVVFGGFGTLALLLYWIFSWGDK